jgi:hypothetical protein
VSAPIAPGHAAEPGSIADLVHLYCPVQVRAVLADLLALEAEIRTSARPDLDHAIAHARLEWWQAEAERALAGKAVHPLTRALCAALAPHSLDLRLLVYSARLELAGLASAHAEAWHTFYEGSLGTVFVVLGLALASTARPATLRALGGALQQLTIERGAPRPALGAALQALPPALQPALRPLLVWVALVGWRTARGIAVPDEAPPPGVWLGLAQQWVAWRAARAAEAGAFRWRWRPAAIAPPIENIQ